MEHAPTMPANTHTQRILDLTNQRGLLRASDLDASGTRLQGGRFKRPGRRFERGGRRR